MPKQNTSPADYPQAVLRQIELLAQNIAIARKRRGETQAQWASKLGVSVPTVARIERGDPSVAVASYVMCMWLINQAEGLADLVAPLNDHAALEREVSKVRSRQQQRKPVAAGSAPVDQVAAARQPQPAARFQSSAKAANANAAGLAALLNPAGMSAMADVAEAKEEAAR
jgi:transcriptional regulator with XRE-family HTH domain